MVERRLRDALVQRGGITARYMIPETSSVYRQCSCYKKKGVERDCLRFSFTISSKGGGTTEIWLNIGSRDFASILECMTEVDRYEAMAAMSGELARQVAKQADIDTETRSELLGEGRHSVRRLARKKFERASGGRDSSEWFILQNVRRLVDELDGTELADDGEGGAPGAAEAAEVN